MRTRILALAVVVVGLAAFGAIAQGKAKKDAPPPPPTTAPTQPLPPAPAVTGASHGDGVAAWLDVVKVLQSPRCQNCHPAGDVPRTGDNGAPHAMEVRRGLDRVGMSCQSCHRVKATAESRAVGAPPAVPGWGLPPAEHPMVFEGRTPTQICEAMRDPAQNGGKDAAALDHHVAEDALVGYGWDPGGRRSLPPLSRDVFVARFRTWLSTGMPCP